MKFYSYLIAMNYEVNGFFWMPLLQDFDPIRHVLEHVPVEENELTYFEKQVWFMFLNLALG